MSISTKIGYGGQMPKRVGEEGRGRRWQARWCPDGHGQEDEAHERENRELRQANEILREGSAHFAQAALDRRFRT
jgi:hypothetical protein